MTLLPPHILASSQKLAHNNGGPRQSDGNMPVNLLPALSLSLAALVAVLVYKGFGKRSSNVFPPGPIALPLVGNIFNFPTESPWVKFLEWSRQYNSDAISLTVLGKRIVILNTAEAVQELFVTRGLNYSSRPRIPLLDIVGSPVDWLFLNYTPNRLWRDHRKLYRREFDTQTLLHRPYELAATRRLLAKLLVAPDDYLDHLRSTASSAILGTTFGIPLQSSDDPLIAMVKSFSASLDKATGVGALVNVFPVLRHLPKWFPGAGFHKTADELRKRAIDMLQVPLARVQQQMSEGSAHSSVAMRGLQALEEEDGEKLDHDLKILKNVLAGIYAAGADTTLTAMRWFVLAMVKYPEIQAKASAAILKQTEGKRLPDFATDYGNIPYLDALLNEVLRFFPVLPIGMPHCVEEDDVYNGYYMPKGTIVFGNSWALMRDERLYGVDSDVFRPERFLKSDGTLNLEIPPPDQAFGYGRRVCAGKNVALEFLWIMMASILSVFELGKTIAEDGSLVEPDGKHAVGALVCYPVPFRCKISARSPQAEQMIISGALIQ